MLTKEELATHRAIQRLGQKIPDLTLRDLFAMSYMNGLVSRVHINDNYKEKSEFAYKVADAMLEAREKK
jgi:hypothetical protein